MIVQVMVPYNAGMHPDLCRRNWDVLRPLGEAFRIVVNGETFDFSVWKKPDTPEDLPGDRIERLAVIRNHFLNKYLCFSADYLIMMDADIVECSLKTLVELTYLSHQHKAVVAPSVFVEHFPDRWYDTWGFEKGGEFFHHKAPHLLKTDTSQPLVELDAVGTIYCTPAAPFREGVRYSAVPGHTDHFSICQALRLEHHMKVYWATQLRVAHANLPEFGLPWN